MRRFDPNATDDITSDDLLAFHLGELTPGQARAFQRALSMDPVRQAESDTLAELLAALEDTPVTMDPGTADRIWQALRPSLTAHATASPTAPAVPPWRVFLVGALAVAGLVAVVVLLPTRKQTVPAVYPHATAPLADSRTRTPAERTPPSDSGRNAGQHPTSPIPRPRLHLAKRENGDRKTPPGERIAGVQPELLSLPTTSVLPTRPALPTTPLSASPAFPSPSTFAVLPAPALLPTPNGPVAPDTTAGQQRASSRSASRNAQRSTAVTDLVFGFGADVTAPHHSLTAGSEPRDFTASPSLLVMASFHQQLRNALGYRVTASYTRPDYHYNYAAYSSAGGFNLAGAIHTNIFQAAGTYVVRGPRRKRISTSFDVGAGLMAFVPEANASASYSYRAAGVVGGTAQYALTPRWGVQLSYRAELFRTPDFRYSGGVIPVTTDLVVSHEPVIGIAYRLGRK